MARTTLYCRLGEVSTQRFTKAQGSDAKPRGAEFLSVTQEHHEQAHSFRSGRRRGGIRLGSGFAGDLTFDLVNNSSYTVTNFFTSPTTTDNWEEDVLGQDTLGPGQTVSITVADGSVQCNYDMKFVAEGASDLVINGVDLCKLDGNKYTLTDAK